jgi:AcrR family transcriptional regulator
MKEVIRMKNQDTRSALVSAARVLFAEHGYDGTAVRAITAMAKANLGAITYHFGSKRALYEAVIESVTATLRGRLAAAAAKPGNPLDRIELVVRTFFDFLAENPDLPRFMMQQMISSQPLTKATLYTLEANIGTLASVIAEGQKDRSVRPGDPRLMALSIGAQPIFLTMARRALQNGVAIDQDDLEIRVRLVDSVVQFVRSGLASPREKAE